jgi:hypothetical protein
MSGTVVMGSMEIWRDLVKGQKADRECEGDVRREIEEEVRRLEEPGGKGRRSDQAPGSNEEVWLEESDDDTGVELMEDIGIGELEEDDDSPEHTRSVVLIDPGSDEDGGREEDEQ